MRRTLWLVAPLAIIALAASPAFGDHHEETDGCDHGATSVPCRPDPQPDHGKDCEQHGNHGGVNEDHCLSETTTTSEPPDTTTSTQPILTTTTTIPADSGSPTIDTSTNPISPTTGTASPSLDLQPTTNSPQPMMNTATKLPSELPHTGADAGLLFVIGTAVLLAGLSCWFAGKAIE